ncbi:MAG: histidine kinase [Saprospiraceae bacterium]|nr:histidine kinase [Saprospiraceae bacterium]
MVEKGVSPGTIAAEIAVDLITALPEDLPSRLSAALRRILAASGSQSCFVVRRVSTRSPRYRLVCRVDGEATVLEPDDRDLPGAVFASWESTLRESEQIYIPDTSCAGTGTEVNFLDGFGYRSVLVIPMQCRGYYTGFLGLATIDHIHSWDDRLRAPLQIAAEVLGNVLDRNDTDIDLAELRRLRRTTGRKALETQEQEWRFLARELHDEIGPYLTAIKTEATLISAKGDSKGADDVVAHAGSIKDQADHIYTAVHDLIRRLRSTVLDELGLEGAVRNCIAESPLMKMPVRCEVEIRGDLQDIEDTVASSILRVLQECLTNVARHAQANRVSVSLIRHRAEIADRRARYRHGGRHDQRASLQQDSITLRVSDDGCGMDLETMRPGMGLRGMRERVEALGGHLDVVSSPGCGTEIGAQVVLSVTSGND